eukprot:5495576-Alexandrium_andersonii.AAC.1
MISVGPWLKLSWRERLQTHVSHAACCMLGAGSLLHRNAATRTATATGDTVTLRLRRLVSRAPWARSPRQEQNSL